MDEIKSLKRSNAIFTESTKGKKTYEVEHRNKCYKTVMFVMLMSWMS